MDKMEFTFRTLGKFLAIAWTAKVYKEIYNGDIPQVEIMKILNDLQITSDDYLYPKHILKCTLINNNLPSSEDDNYNEEDFLNDVGC